MVIFYTAFNQVIFYFQIRFFNPLLAFSLPQKTRFALLHGIFGNSQGRVYLGISKSHYG